MYGTEVLGIFNWNRVRYIYNIYIHARNIQKALISLLHLLYIIYGNL